MFRWKGATKRSGRPMRFRLAGLIIFMSVISVLAAVGLGQYRDSIAAAREAVLKNDLLRLRNAIHQYVKDRGHYPGSLDSLVANGYLRTIPQDPITKSRNTWATTPTQRDPLHPDADPGVFDVKSGARGTARDGSKYSEW